MNGKTNFGHADGQDLKDLFKSQIDNVKSLIESNDKNYNQRFDNVIEATKSALAAADKATLKAEAASEKRFENVNEFRAVLTSQQNTFIPRAEFDLVSSRLEQDIKNLSSARSELLPTSVYKSSHDSLQLQVDELRINKALLEGKASASSVYIGYAISFIGIAMGVISLLR